MLASSPAFIAHPIDSASETINMLKAALVLALALAIATLNPAMAQDAPAASQLRFLLGAGLTAGGDRLLTAENQGRIDTDIRAGRSLAVNAGGDYRVNSNVSLQATVGYHVANTSFFSFLGEASFHRYPLEVLAYYNTGPQWRVGGGLRYLINPRLESNGVFGEESESFDNSVGGVIEAEYLLRSRVGIKLRYVHETIKAKELLGKVDGSHVGLFVNYYF